MKLFHGSLMKQGIPNSILKHFGSHLAAAQRLESMFSAQEQRAYSRDDTFTVISLQGVPQRSETVEQHFANLLGIIISLK